MWQTSQWRAVRGVEDATAPDIQPGASNDPIFSLKKVIRNFGRQIKKNSKKLKHFWENVDFL